MRLREEGEKEEAEWREIDKKKEREEREEV